MATEWFVRRGEKTSGPFNSKQLKSLAKSGRLKPEDLIRKGSEGKFFPITRVQGLFEAPPEEEEWSVESQEDSVQVRFAEADDKLSAQSPEPPTEKSDNAVSLTTSVPKSIAANTVAKLKQKASALASQLGHAAKTTARLSWLKAEETNLTNIKLPGLYSKVGESICKNHEDRIPSEIRQQQDKIAELDRQTANGATPTTLVDKAKSIGQTGRTIAQRVFFQQQIGRMYAAFGEQQFDANREELVSAELVKQIESARKQLEDIRKELSVLGGDLQNHLPSGLGNMKSASFLSELRSPFRINLRKVWTSTGIAIVGLLLATLVFRTKKQDIPHHDLVKLPSISNKTQTEVQQPTSATQSSTTNAVSILNDASRRTPAIKDYSFLTLTDPVATIRAKTGLEGKRISPDGSHICMQFSGVWNVKTGKQLLFELRPGYISGGGEMSPDGKQIAVLHALSSGPSNLHTPVPQMLKIYRIAGETPILESSIDLKPDNYGNLQWSSDSRRIFGKNANQREGTGSSDCMNGFVVTLTDGKPTLARLSHSSESFRYYETDIPHFAFSSDGTRCLMRFKTSTPQWNAFDFFDSFTGRRLSTLESPYGIEEEMRFRGFSPDAQTCLFYRGKPNADGQKIILVNVNTAESRELAEVDSARELKRHGNFARFSLQSREVNVPGTNQANATKTVYEVWDEVDKRLVAVVPRRITALSSDGRYATTEAASVIRNSKTPYGVDLWDTKIGSSTQFQRYTSSWYDPNSRPRGPIYFVLTDEEKRQGWSTPETESGTYRHPAPLITREKFDQLREKMSRRKVAELLGGAPHKSHSTMGTEANGHTWWWENTEVYCGDKPSSGAILVFRRDGKHPSAIGDEQLIQKIQKGL